jgi:hypothetical protein
VLLRLPQQRANSWEGSFDDALVEFNDRKTGEAALSLSVYEIEDGAPSIVRVAAEHRAGGDPTRPKDSVHSMDFLCGEGPQPVAEQGDSWFSFVRSTHRTLDFANEADQRAFARAVYDTRKGRARPVHASEIIAYARQKILDREPEWIARVERDGGYRWQRLAET